MKRSSTIINQGKIKKFMVTKKTQQTTSLVIKINSDGSVEIKRESNDKTYEETESLLMPENLQVDNSFNMSDEKLFGNPINNTPLSPRQKNIFEDSCEMLPNFTKEMFNPAMEKSIAPGNPMIHQSATELKEAKITDIFNKMKQKNEKIRRRHLEVEADKQNADVFNYTASFSHDSKDQSAESLGRCKDQRPQHLLHGQYTHKDSPAEARWRAERNRIDEARIQRQKTTSGNWRREWDKGKKIMNLESIAVSRFLPVVNRKIQSSENWEEDDVPT